MRQCVGMGPGAGCQKASLIGNTCTGEGVHPKWKKQDVQRARGRVPETDRRQGIGWSDSPLWMSPCPTTAYKHASYIHHFFRHWFLSDLSLSLTNPLPSWEARNGVSGSFLLCFTEEIYLAAQGGASCLLHSS